MVEQPGVNHGGGTANNSVVFNHCMGDENRTGVINDCAWERTGQSTTAKSLRGQSTTRKSVQRLVSCDISLLGNHLWQHFPKMSNVFAALVHSHSIPKVLNAVHKLLFCPWFYFSSYELLQYWRKYGTVILMNG